MGFGTFPKQSQMQDRCVFYRNHLESASTRLSLKEKPTTLNPKPVTLNAKPYSRGRRFQLWSWQCVRVDVCTRGGSKGLWFGV